MIKMINICTKCNRPRSSSELKCSICEPDVKDIIRVAKTLFPIATVECAVKVLNGMLTCDREAIETLIEYRVPCNEELLNHPTAQVVASPDGILKIGLLGVLNGIFGCGADSIAYIVAVFDDNGKLIRFETLG